MEQNELLALLWGGFGGLLISAILQVAWWEKKLHQLQKDTVQHLQLSLRLLSYIQDIDAAVGDIEHALWVDE